MLKWYPAELKKKLISELTENAEIVGKFVETDARQRLMEIRDPEWGQGHRNYVSRLLTNVVEKESNAVVIKIGLPPGKTTKEGRPTRHIGFYIEMGDAHHAAHPYLRPAVFMNAARILALLSGK